MSINTGSENTLSTWYAPGCEYTPQDEGSLSLFTNRENLFLSNGQRNFFTHTFFVRIESIQNGRLYFNVLFHQYSKGICFRSFIPINIHSTLEFEQIIRSIFINHIPLIPSLQSLVVEYYAPYQELCKFSLYKVLTEKNLLSCEDLGDTISPDDNEHLPSSLGIDYLHIFSQKLVQSEINDHGPEEAHQDHQIDFLTKTPQYNPFSFLFSYRARQPDEVQLPRPVYAFNDGNLDALIHSSSSQKKTGCCCCIIT